MCALRQARCQEALFANLESGSPDVTWQSKRGLANLEAARLLVGLRRFGGASVVVAEEGVVAEICQHADAANVGAQREVGRVARARAGADGTLIMLQSNRV